MPNSKVMVSYSLVLLVCIGLAYSIDTLKDEDYKDPAKVNDALRSNPQNVDYAKIDFSNPSLDYSLLDYNRIPSAGFSQLDNKRVNYNKLFKDIKRNDISVNLNRNYPKLEKLPNGQIKITHPTNPSQNVVLNNLPQKSLVSVTKSDIEIILPKGAGKIPVSGMGNGVLVAANAATLNNGFKFRGKLNFENGRLYVKEGRAIVINEVNKVAAYRGDVNIYIKSADLPKDKKENFFFIDNNRMAVRTAENGKIGIEIGQNHPIFKTDAKDRLFMTIANGDGLEITNRETTDTIPFVKHISSDKGSMLIDTDRLKFQFAKGKYNIIPPVEYDEDFYKKKYQSVAMQMASDSFKQEIRINSADQYAVLTENKNQRVAYNKFDLPISDSLKDNSFQTIEDLRKRYPNIKFGIPADPASEASYDEGSISPLAIQIIDRFLQLRPNAKNSINYIGFGTFRNSFGGNLNIKIGEPTVFERVFKTQREPETLRPNSPLTSLNHEYEHILDTLINREDKGKPYKSLQSYYDEIALQLFDKLKKDKIFREIANSLKKEAEANANWDPLKDQEEYEYFKYVLDNNKGNLDRRQKILLDKRFTEVTGLLGTHAMDMNTDGSYWELSSYYAELPLFSKRIKANSGNADERTLYRTLTQLAYDAGKLSVEDCEYVMASSCQKCVIYEGSCYP